MPVPKDPLVAGLAPQQAPPAGHSMSGLALTVYVCSSPGPPLSFLKPPGHNSAVIAALTASPSVDGPAITFRIEPPPPGPVWVAHHLRWGQPPCS